MSKRLTDDWNIPGNLPTFKEEELSDITLDTQSNSGISLYVYGHPMGVTDESNLRVLAVKLSPRVAILLAKEILYRVYNSYMTKINRFVNNGL